MFSHTFKSSYSENFWLIYPIFFLTCSYCVAMSKPATVPFPPVGCDKPHNMRMAVVFPAPLAPRKPKISPCLTLNEIWSTAVKLPNCLVKPSTSMAYRPVTCGSLKESPSGERIELNCWRIRSGVSMPWIFPSRINAIRSQHFISFR